MSTSDDDVIFGNGFDNTLDGGAGNDTLFGLGGDDFLIGGTGHDRPIGGWGNDRLDGGSGADHMFGGSGHDTYFVDDSGDIVDEDLFPGDDGGIDTVNSSVSFELGAFLENLTLTGSAAIDGTGNLRDNRLTGNDNDNTLNGSAGLDTMIGGDGDDRYFADRTGDTVLEDAGEGTDTVRSSASFALGSNVENLTLTGSASTNGFGNSQANRVTGSSGDNVLDGKAGNDTLKGREGEDTFAFSTSLNAATNVDTVADFVSGSDQFSLDREVFTELSAGGLSAPAFVQAMAATTNKQRIIYDQSSGLLSYDSDGKGGAAAVAFAQLTPGQEIDRHDFTVV